jgi:tetratricopeptide (TPR) repeat protein
MRGVSETYTLVLMCKALPKFVLGSALLLCTHTIHAQGVPAEPREAWRQYLDLGRQLFSQGHYSAAEEALKAAVKEAEFLKTSDVPLGTALRQLGMLYHVQKRNSEAQRAYEHAAVVLAIDPVAAPREYALTLQHLADLHVAERRLSEARQLYQRCVEVIEKQIGAADGMLIDPLQGWARLALLDGDHDKAVQLAERALALVRRQPDPSLPRIVQIVEVIGTTFAQSGNYAKAEAVLDNLLGLANKAYGNGALHSGRIAEKLADVYRERLQFAEAENLLRQRLSGSAERPSDAVATTLNNLAEYLLVQQSFEEAEVLLLRSFRVRQSVSGAEDPELAVTLYNLGSLYADQGRTDEARKVLSEALSICEKSLPPEHSETQLIVSFRQGCVGRKIAGHQRERGLISVPCQRVGLG